MADDGHGGSDWILARMERLIRHIYLLAHNELKTTVSLYFAAFAKKDERKREQVAEGVISDDEYKRWRIGQLLAGERWIALRRAIARDYHNANVTARRVIDGVMPDIYALNMNYMTYSIEKQMGVDTAFTLYNREAVENILREDPQMLPAPGKKLAERIAAGKDILWNNEKIQAVMMQAILQGDSISDIADRLERVTEYNRNNAIRNARTMTTAAENKGRLDAMKRAQSKGIKMNKTWVATLDYRTRHAHRALDGQTVPVDEPFKYGGVELMEPGDLSAPGWMIYNCRCTMISQIKGFERDVSDLSLRKSDKLEGMSYEQWKENRRVDKQSIQTPEEIAKLMRARYAAEYRKKGKASEQYD